MPGPETDLEIAAYDFAAAQRLRAKLGVSQLLAQILTRRGLGAVDAAEAFLAADQRHELGEFGGLAEAAERIVDHIRKGSRITIHGDYDVDGMTATTILVRTLREVAAHPDPGQIDWYIPSRLQDGYGFSAASVQRLKDRGTDLIVTVDCGITAVEEAELAKAARVELIITDHHAPRGDGKLPDCRIVHPLIGGYPCPELCAAGVAYKLATAVLIAAGQDPANADNDLDLVALATIADVVPLIGENRRLVREGLKALATTKKPGLRALMSVAKVEPGALDTQAVGFRLAPRLNAAGRLYRADAGVELLLTDNPERAAAIATELNKANQERRDIELKMRFEAEAQVAQCEEDASAYVLAAEGWHSGVIGIVASRIAERYHRPTIMIALDCTAGTASGSGRSIPGFDLLAGLEAGAAELRRFGGHRAAAGLSIDADRIDAFRELFTAHASSVLTPEDLVRKERIDAVVSDSGLTLSAAEELTRLAPFGAGNPAPNLLVPGALLEDPRPIGGDRHLAFTVNTGSARAKAVSFGQGTKLPVSAGQPADAAVRLEINRFNGFTTPQLILRSARPVTVKTIDLLGEPTSFAVGVRAEINRTLEPWPPALRHTSQLHPRETNNCRDEGTVAVLADLVASGEPVLAVSSHPTYATKALSQKIGGFAACSWTTLEENSLWLEKFTHLVVLDPPPQQYLDELAGFGPVSGWTHQVWGRTELDFAHKVNEWNFNLKQPLRALYRDLRSHGSVCDLAAQELLKQEFAGQPRTPALAGRLVRILLELELISFDESAFSLTLQPAPVKIALESSPAFLAYQLRLEDGRQFLTKTSNQAVQLAA